MEPMLSKVVVDDEPPLDTAMTGQHRIGSSIEDLLVTVARLASTISDSPIFSEQGIGPADWSLLKVLEAGPLSSSELVRQTNLSRQRVRVLVKELEAKKLLTVTQQREGDRRTRMVQLLPQAAATLAETSRRIEALNVPTKTKRFTSAVKQTRLLLRLLLRERRLKSAASRAKRSEAGETREGVRAE